MAAAPDLATSPSSREGSTSAATTELRVEGMTCGNCARHVTEALQSVAGVRAVSVSLDSHQASVRWNAGARVEPTMLVSALEAAGYEGKPVSECDCGHHDHGSVRLGGWELNLWVGVLGTVPLMLGEWIFGLAMAPWFQWTSFLIASVVQVIAGGPFYRGAWKQAKVGSSNMDTLVALGSTTAFAYSTWALLTHAGGHLYFMEAASIITLISVGHWVEARVSTRASGALRELMDLAPQRARRVDAANGNAGLTLSDVPLSELQPGDVVEVRPGDSVPTDGQVTEGSTAVDESMLTGESKPADKLVGTAVYGGTVNVSHRVLVRVTAVGEATALAHVIAAVQRAQTSRAEIQRIGDRVSNVFVPIVVSIALLAGCWWAFAPETARHVHDWLSHFLWHTHAPAGAVASGFIIAAAVLIVACPCAMGLATPAAIMAAANAAARRGILIRDGVALEKAGRITAVVFDKTGTLTMGRPAVTRIWTATDGALDVSAIARASQQVREALATAAAVAARSSHPLSHSVATTFSGGNVHLAGSEEVKGSGVQALSGGTPGTEFQLGSLEWLRERGIQCSEAAEFINETGRSGASVVGFATAGRLQAVFALQDEIKPGAAEVVDRLHLQGLKTFMITGDNRATAESVALKAGIRPENIFAQVRPEKKAEIIQKLQQEGERVAFVGDGINDAPALEQADLGIAVSRASDIAREAADIILLKSEIAAVPESLDLAQATLRTIKQNLFWAFFYNALGIPLAAFGLMSPILCAAAMGFSDIIVIGNALRLLRFGRRG